jgi:hypothetical protein
MRYALRFTIVFCLMMVRVATAQTQDVNATTNPFEPPPAGGVNASIGDEDDTERPGLSFPKLSMPKIKFPEWKMPKLTLPKLPARETQPTQQTRMQPRPPTRQPVRRPAEPSGWQKLNQNTKSFFAKTRTTLMPWTVDDVERRPRNVTGGRARTASRNAGRSSVSDSKPFLPFLPKKEPAEKRIESTTDFLSLPKPPYE